MAVITRRRKDGTKTYLVRVRDPEGNWYPAETFEVKSEAKTKEAELEKKREDGDLAAQGGARRILVNRYYPVWVHACRKKTSEGWAKDQDKQFEKYIEPVIGDKMLAKVKSTDVSAVLDRMEKLDLGPQMRIHVYNLMNKMFDDANEYFKMKIENPVLEKFHRAELKESVVVTHSPEQAWQLLRHARAVQHYAAPLVWMQTLSTLRCEASIPLVWPDVMFDFGASGKDHFRITRYWKKKVKKLVEHPKNGKAELVPIPAPLREYLLELRAEAQDLDGLVCQGPKGGMLSYQTYRKALFRLCDGAGVPRITPHGNRHNGTELWALVGAGEEDVGRLLTQKSRASVKRYMHQTPTRLQELGAKMQPFTVIEGGALFTAPVHNVNEKACITAELEAVEA